jgi:hypothetical protein
MIEFIKNAFMYVFTFVFIGGLLFLLGGIIRYSIISPILTRGAKTRIRSPNLEGVEKVVGFTPNSEIVNFYRQWPHIEKTEYYLVDSTNNKNWFIGGFTPLSKIDIKEEIKVSGKHGLPLADDLNKGMYFLQEDGSIELWSPNVDGGHVKVAQSIDELSSFAVVEPEVLFPDTDDA